jgi:branched-chain amino acid transport system substrate-binding protein
VRELITEDDVSVLAGPLFPACVESAADIAKDAQVTVLTPVPSALRLPAASTVTRLTFTEEQEGAAMAEFAVKTLRLKTAGMVVDGKLPASEERAEAFRKKFTSLGGKVLVQVGYSTGDKSFRRAALMISRTKPGVIYLSGAGPDSAAVVAAMKDAKLSGVIVGSSDWNAAENPPEALPGKSSVHVPARFNPASSDPAVKEFVAAFKRDLGRDPDALAALGYDAGLVICQALQRATGGQASAVTKEIAATAAVPGVTGKLTAKNGVIAGTVEVMKVNGRETVFETSIPVQ